MKRWLVVVVCAVAAAGCADRGLPSGEGDGPLLSASGDVPATVFNTQLRSELEVPVSTSESKGLAQVKVFRDGTIESMVIINNKSVESVRFGHIHHVNAGQPTGPVIWWLSSPVGVDLNITDRHIDIRQQGIFVANAHYATHEDALAALLADPSSFYVNFHSDAFPGGFARGFLP